MTQRELDARVASIQYTETTDLNLPAIEVAGDAFEAGVEWADSHPRWISVEDELPPNKCGFSDEVLTYSYASKRYVVAMFCYISNCWFGCDDTVTHWMALPKPPAKLSSLERIGKEESNDKEILRKVYSIRPSGAVDCRTNLRMRRMAR